MSNAIAECLRQEAKLADKVLNPITVRSFILGAKEIERLADRGDELSTALHMIAQWSEAYPTTIFPEPDLKKARELLEAGGITLDAISAHCMRHVVQGVGKIARDALNKESDREVVIP